MKRTGGMLLLAVILMVSALPYPLQGTAFADGPEIELKMEIGYGGGWIKQGTWNPLKLVLKSSEDLTGDIVIRIQNNNGMGEEASYVQRVDLPKDTEKEVTIGIPGNSYNKDNNEISFYEDSYRKGKPVPFVGGKKYVSKSAVSSGMVGVLSDDPDTMNFLSTLNGKGSNLLKIPLRAENMYDDAMLMDGLDVLVINNFASDTLSQPQQDAVKSWVRSGGTLVLAGGAGYSKTAAPFADIAPLQSNGTSEVTEMPELEKLGGKALNLDGNFTISTGTPAEGTVVESMTSDAPLFAYRKADLGKVWYAAYDVSMEPVNSWAGHPAAWASLLRNELPMTNNGYYGGSMMDSLSYALDYFPSIKMPSFPMLLWMLIIYAVVAAPLLYFILKKADKREWAWFLIPLIAVVASAAVYVVGSADKTKEMAHTLNVIELDGEGKGMTSSASAFFTPRSGDYELEFPENTYLKTYRNNGGFGGGLSENKSFIRMDNGQTSLELRDMPQWSLAKVSADNPLPQERGQLAVVVDLNDKGEVVGKVRNETLNDLKQVVLVVGGRAFLLGDIPQDGSADIPTDKKLIKQVSGNLSDQLYPYGPNGMNDKYTRERQIVQSYSYQPGVFMNNAYIFGWSEDDLTNYTLKGKAIESDQLNFWVQPVDIQWGQNGAINIPYGFITPQVTQANAPNFMIYPHGVELGQGSVVMEFPLMPAVEAEYSEFSIKGVKLGNSMTMEIWNVETSEWEPVPADQNVFTVKENPERYVVDNRIRFSINSTSQGMFQLPQLSLKGEVK
ncbi:DUF7408 domain-containing protein [Paenibacillus lemnae]|uniref:Glutamine amidotransferase domain-containing protein n=1 Tax=Paenibacillus lemnae TaxID=1330551 RepID=A0A848M8H1_PAELE|nr:hypothetical protein [Paenibacillus lemnae]NMO95804.1 hypothetical protein [Paenibacillus lemnae]